jgi:hypothetical protein
MLVCGSYVVRTPEGTPDILTDVFRVLSQFVQETDVIILAFVIKQVS